ncbi:MAG: DUF2959 family protein [Planctomycetota bacterium]|jgi:hypothetical protein
MQGLKIGLAACLALVIACESAPKGQQQSDKLNSAVQKLGANASAAESNLRIAMEAYDALLNSEGDLKAPYQTFEGGLKKCEKLVSEIAVALAKCNEMAANYFTTYEGNLETIQDEGVREESRARLETRRSAYTAFQTHVQAYIDNYKPILAKMRARAQALGLELTPATIATAKGDRDEIAKMAEEWYKRGTEISAGVDKFLKENAPTAGG